MKQWFPFTDYDFYAYLTAGVLLLATLDYTVGSATLVNRSDWTIPQFVFWILVSYVAGQLVAAPSAALIEHVIARRLFHPPIQVLLGLKPSRFRERIINAVFVGHNYQALPPLVRSDVLQNAARLFGQETLTALDSEAIFQLGYGTARQDIGRATRLDQLRNVYGFNRNLAFVAAIATCLVVTEYVFFGKHELFYLLLIAPVVFVCALGRFMKFYASFAAEVLRALSTKPPKSA